MFLAASDALWRGLVLLALALAPYAAPLDVAAAASLPVAGVRLAISLVVLLGVTALVVWLGRRSRAVGIASTAAVVAVLALGLGLPASRWPLARIVWLAAPLVWAIVVLAVADGVGRADLAGSRRWLKWAAGVAVATVGVVSLLLSAPRLRSRQALLAANPGFEPAALDEAQDLARQGRASEAGAVLKRCADSNPDACGCLSRAAAAELDSRRYGNVVTWTSRAQHVCFAGTALLGARAEALAGEASNDGDAIRTADAALKLDERDAHAVYAKAIVWLRRGDTAQSLRFTREAVGWGRGTEARVFLAGVLMQSGDLEAAQSELEDAIAADPKSVAALYDLALVAQRRGQYRAAREGYLRVLALDPNALDARYNLVVLTHGLGADAEARSHVDEMAKVSPGDPRIAPLRSILSPVPQK